MNLLLMAAAAFLALGARADEGMWTLDNLPVKQLEERYGFKPTADWVEHVRLASVRFNDGGSGGFVSPNGLVITNHHVALGQLQKVSTREKDFVKDGFYARDASEEMKCPDLELNVLQSIENVTERVVKAVDQAKPESVQNEQRKGEMSRIEKESTDKTGLRSDVVELYQGGEYWLYRYKKYTDIRLVMAPEQQTAFYGGDPDNFTYPRFDIDMAFFRVYENGKPVRPTHYFKWSSAGAKDGELTFVSGHPGKTDRLDTAAQLEFQRDESMPFMLRMYSGRVKALKAYAAKSPEQERRAKDRVFSFENAVKAFTGEIEGLRDAKLMAKKAEEEKDLRDRVAAVKALSEKYGGAWDRIAAATAQFKTRYKAVFARQRLAGTKLPELANTIVRCVAEVNKPNDKRYEEFRDSALESLNLRLFSPAPIFPDLEEAAFADALAFAQREVGPDDPWVKAALEGRTPEAEAAELIRGTKLADAQVRKALVQGGVKAVEASTDPLIVWARKLDPDYRELRKWFEDNIQPVEAFDGKKIAAARFAVYGKGAYPDATFTLRLSYGKVAGYESGTTRVPYKTTFFGLFARADSFDGRPPYNIMPRVLDARPKLDLSTPLDFVTTNDIVGGNSGSPVLNRDAEYVGLIFDGNIESLAGRYLYSEEQSRAVAVHSRGILEALRKIYGMQALADELTGPAAPR
ncbi:MAG: S46 family peptidase [Elusimicrobia bacterium]|nr:S46 family peptidase [Elusimicrobiota bacterium]